ncbi:MAG: hypothetical protein ABIW83_04915 [Allosphingosinicella sp.]
MELRLLLRFDPALCGAAESPRAAWLEIGGRFAEAAGGKASPGSIGVVTSLGARPLVGTSDGRTLRQGLAQFVAEVLADFTKVVDVELAFSLPKAGAKALRDFCPIDVRLDYGDGDWATASPRLDGDLGIYPFTAAFEDAWQGFNDGTGRLALAAVSPDRTALWCVRTGKDCGISVAKPGFAASTHHAMPPLALVPLDGTVDSEDGACDRFNTIDLDRWWDLFAEAMERFAAASADETRERLAGVRLRLAAAMAHRLAPIGPAASGDGIEELRAVCEEVLADDLRLRPVLVGAAVDIGRGDASVVESGAVLSGRAFSPSGTAAAPGGSPAAVRLDAGRRWLAFAAPPMTEGPARQTFSIRFEGDRIAGGGAPPLDVILHAPAGTDALAVDFGPRSAPVPLIGLPAPPAISAAAAITSTEAATLAEALEWNLEVATSTTPAEQDRLELGIAVDGEPAPVLSPAPGSRKTLFETLGRAVLYSAKLPAEPETGSLAAFATLAEAVADTLPAWRAPSPDIRELPGSRRYGFEFDELPVLVVTRHSSGSGPLPHWPEVAGYSAPACDGETARYEPSGVATGAGLRIAVPGLRLLSDRTVRVHGRVERNSGLANPAFVYHSPIASSQALSPCLEWQAPRPEAPAATLEAALLAVLATIDEGSGDPYRLGLEAVLVRRLESAGEERVEARIPLGLLPPVEIGGKDAWSVAGLAGEIAAALSWARAGIEAEGREAEIALAITLFDREPARTPLAKLGVRVPVPEDEAWWQTASPRRRDWRR